MTMVFKIIFPTFQKESCCDRFGAPASIIRGLGFSSQRATGARHGAVVRKPLWICLETFNSFVRLNLSRRLSNNESHQSAATAGEHVFISIQKNR